MDLLVLNDCFCAHHEVEVRVSRSDVVRIKAKIQCMGDR